MMPNCESGAINSSVVSNVSSSSYMDGASSPPPPINPEQLANELLKQTSADSEHLRSAKLHHLTSFIASRSSSMCTAGSHSPLSPNIYRALMLDDSADLASASSKSRSKSGSAGPDAQDNEDEKVRYSCFFVFVFSIYLLEKN